MRIFDSIPPKSECIFPFLYNLIFKPYHLWNPLAPLWWGDRHMPLRTFFVQNSMLKNFYLELFFFSILHIFGSVQPKSECIFPFLYNLIFQLNTGDNHILGPVAIKNGICPHSCYSSALTWQGSKAVDSHHEK